MSKHLFGLVVTHHGTAANNRGENEGNITTLQKILWNGEVHTTVSAEAIRWAIRYYWQRVGKSVNRKWDEDANDHRWEDEDWLPWTDPQGKGKGKQTFIDDDVLGFMLAEAGKAEGNEAEIAEGKGKKKSRVKGTCDKRRGALEVTRALSLTPFAGDITFNAKSGQKTSTSLYGTEVHATRYQYGFVLTPEWLRDKSRTLDVVDAVVSLAEVAGNQSRFLFDFSPDAVIFRWTDDFAPRFLYGFTVGDGTVAIRQEVLDRIKSKDIAANEIVVGGSIATTAQGTALKEQGAVVLDGVKAAADEVKQRIRRDLELK
ncbi:DevR family CRISPR-associated autoregulator [Nitrospira moscoviensis]|uniref:CRISPR-associated protein Cas7/Cst2/DevR n=1 Tax=Nitrospira moscoviensis TaxID=42253 RepID=A0A0K2GBH8_NITMO|nr:DevR family CRISPR-associated autoregulator [Nitrospira moscoviensis]ALA57932.1 CRISPR-associated protein Cas7/Cst2/DevR [Nitrospira moscoviensis]